MIMRVIRRAASTTPHPHPNHVPEGCVHKVQGMANAVAERREPQPNTASCTPCVSACLSGCLAVSLCYCDTHVQTSNSTNKKSAPTPAAILDSMEEELCRHVVWLCENGQPTSWEGIKAIAQQLGPIAGVRGAKNTRGENVWGGGPVAYSLLRKVSCTMVHWDTGLPVPPETWTIPLNRYSYGYHTGVWALSCAT